jgi:hypothetical protein
MPIATQADVEARLLRPLTAVETTYLSALLAKADGEVYGVLPGYRFSGVVNNESLVLRGSGTGELWLTGKPVIAVDSVTVDGRVLDPTEYDWHPYGDLNLTTEGRVFEIGHPVTVVYDYGLAAPPVDVINVAADMIAGAMTNPSGYRQETIGQYSTSYAAVAAGVSPTDDHVRILRRGRRYPVTV